MKQDPPEIYGWRVFVIAATACLGGILFGMDTGTMGGVLVLPAFKKEFGLDGLGKVESANLSANIVSALQAGCFLGAILAWPLADSIGRRTALITAAVIATAGTAMQAASSGYLQAVYLFGILELAQRMLDEAQLENDVPSRPESWAGSQRPSFMRQRSSKVHSLDKIQRTISCGSRAGDSGN